MYRYCVAQVNIYAGKPDVTFYACSNDQYGLHRVSDWDDPNTLWFDTEKEALGFRWNANDCVISRCFEREE